MPLIPIGDAPYKSAEFVEWLRQFKEYLVTPFIYDGSITTNMFANGAVTNAKLANNSVTFTKMTDNSVGTNELIAGTFTNVKFSASSGITSDKIQNYAVTHDKLFGTVVGTTNLIDDELLYGDFATGSVDATKIQNYTITMRKFANGSITNRNFINNTIDVSDKFKNNTITGSKFVVGQGINTNHFIDYSLNYNPSVGYPGLDFANGSITTDKLQSNSVTSIKLATDAIYDETRIAKLTVVGSNFGSQEIKAENFYNYDSIAGKTFLLENGLTLRNNYTRGIVFDTSNVVINSGTYTISVLGFPNNVYTGTIDCFGGTIKSDVHLSGAFCVSGDTNDDIFAIDLQFYYYQGNSKIWKTITLYSFYFSIINTNGLTMIPVECVFNQNVVDTVNGYSTYVGDATDIFKFADLRFVFRKITASGNLTIYLTGQRSSYIEMEV